MHASNEFPPTPQTIDELEDALSTPPSRLVTALRELSGDILVLGVGGKMGPTLARMARRASDAAGKPRRVIGVSRFSSADARQRLEASGVETISADLLDESALRKLPTVENIVYMAGFKFGAAANPSLTWAMNCYLPALVAQRFPQSRFAVFSSGNIYNVTPITQGGSRETDQPAPVGEYAMSVFGRERILEHFSLRQGTPMAILRLNYAVELRYGVLVDLAEQIFHGRAVDMTMGAVNVIWQADANAMALESLAHVSVPPWVVNIAGPEILQVRTLCQRLGELLDRPVHFAGEEAADALLSDGEAGYAVLGYPQVLSEQMLRWTADWLRAGGATLAKPTHFQVRDGKF